MLNVLLLLLSIFGCCILNGALDDHLKPALNKSGAHQLRNIDFVYLINLDQRPEKLELCLKQLLPYGITPYRFSAVNGWELSLEAINDVGVKYEPWMAKGLIGTYFPIDEPGISRDELMQKVGRTYFRQTVAPGAIGCILSHLSVLKDALDSEYETIWVMEDDIEIIQNPHILSDFIEELDALVGKNGWDILFTDRDTKGQDGNYVPCISYSLRPNFSPADPARFGKMDHISKDLKRIGARYGSYSMIIRRSGIKKLLNFFSSYHLFLPYDMEYTLPNQIRLYGVTSDVVSTQPQAPTDNGKCNYKKPKH